jgi:hypothetical protein
VTPEWTGDGLIRVVAARVVRPYVLDVTFNDGFRREIDLEDELWGEVFVPLRDPAFFARAMVDRVLGTVVWPNDADFSPEFLYFGDDRNPYGDWTAGESQVESDDPAEEPSEPLRVDSGERG